MIASTMAIYTPGFPAEIVGRLLNIPTSPVPVVDARLPNSPCGVEFILERLN